LAAWLRRGRGSCACPNVFTRVRAPRLGPHEPRGLGGRDRGVPSCRLPEVNAHRLRHTAATEMLRAGSNLAEIGQVLRHHSLLTTSIYAKVDRASLSAVAQPWPGGMA